MYKIERRVGGSKNRSLGYPSCSSEPIRLGKFFHFPQKFFISFNQEGITLEISLHEHL